MHVVWLAQIGEGEWVEEDATAHWEPDDLVREALTPRAHLGIWDKTPPKKVAGGHDPGAPGPAGLFSPMRRPGAPRARISTRRCVFKMSSSLARQAGE